MDDYLGVDFEPTEEEKEGSEKSCHRCAHFRVMKPRPPGTPLAYALSCDRDHWLPIPYGLFTHTDCTDWELKDINPQNR